MAETFVAMPFLIITVEGALRSADQGFEEAAATLGAKRMTVFLRVTVPMIAPSLGAGAVLCWARALGEFGATITFAGSFPGQTETMPIAVYYALETDPMRRSLSAWCCCWSPWWCWSRCATTGCAAARSHDTGRQRRPGRRCRGQAGRFTLAVSLCAAAGQVLGLLGPNGAGKSTLLSAVAGLTPVSAGRIMLAGQVMDDADTGTFIEASGRPVGFVFQNYRLFPHLTVADNVAFSPRARGLGRRAARSAASYWLGRLGLADLAGRKPDQLSGGQAQRVALARALAGQPALLLLDEPLSALDAGTRLDVQAELKRHLADFTGPCLLVTHDALEALVLADRLIVLESGRIVQQGAPAQIARQPATDYVAKLVGLNLYSGQADGPEVKLAQGGAFVVPDRGRAAMSWSRCGRPPSSSAPSPRSEAAPATPGRRGSPGSRCWPTGSGSTSRDSQPALADVTPAAVAELSLHPGSQVWLSVKATDLEVYARSEG